MESCWGEENMKLYTLNMKKAVAKCNQVDAPELDLPPFRRLNSFVNKMVYMADHKEDQHDDMKMMMGGDGYSEFEAESRHDQNSMPEMFFKMFKKNNEYNDYNDYQRSDNYENKYEKMPMFRKMMSSMRFKRQADDS